MALGDLTPDPTGEFPLPPALYMAHLLYQLVQRRQGELDERFEALGLNSSKWRALFGIWRLESCTMGELARVTTIDRTTLTRVVDRLVEEEMVCRSASATDRRQVILTLTAAGETSYREALAIQSGYSAEMIRGVDEETQRNLCRLLTQLIHNCVADPMIARESIELKVVARDRG